MAILVSTQLEIEIRRIASNPNGRFVKIRIKNKKDDNTITISSVYLEPNGELVDINGTIFESDVIGGYMNNANNGLNKINVFHMKNIEITDKIELENNEIFDHPILLGKIKFETYNLEDESRITILDKEKNRNQL